MESYQKKSLSVVVPVYNEEKTVGQVMASLKSELSKLDVQYEIIAVNDCSQDQSLVVLEKIDGIKAISHPHNKGYGASLKTGIKASQYEWILIIDADGTYPIDSIAKLLEKIPQYDLVVGARDNKSSAIPSSRRHAKGFLNKFAGYLAGREIPDLNSGLRIFKKDIILKYWELFPNKFSFTSTLTMTCLTHQYETIFLPIDYYKRQGKSSLKPFEFFVFLKLIIKLSLFFKPLKVFIPISLFLLFIAILLTILFLVGVLGAFMNTTIMVLCATALQTFFFGLLAEIVIHNK
ncbi:MAG: glycosyltransferase family 2 protein [Patescibacteria group bacterium]